MHKTKALFNEYYSFANDYPQNIVFKHMKEMFYDRSSLDEESDIPHPYRQYVILGQRMVIESILEAVKVVESGKLDEYLAQQEENNDARARE